MQLTLADGWTEVSPKDTSWTLLLSGQPPGQRLVAVNTSFTRQKDLAFSGGGNCPLAIDRAAARVYFSADHLTSICLRTGDLELHATEANLGIFWMLEYRAQGPHLVMLLHDQQSQCLGRCDLQTGTLRRVPLPAEAFSPLAVDLDRNLALFTAGTGGAALCDLTGATSAVASVALPRSVLGGCFLPDGDRAILGGAGLVGWNLRTGTVSPLCAVGRYPKCDRNGDIWFCTEDGNLCRLRTDGSGYDVIVELNGVDPRGSGFAHPIVFSPDGRYGLARLTGKTPLTGKDLADAEAFCKRHGQPFSDRHRHRYDHVFCLLDFDTSEVWCHNGYAHNLAWVEGDFTI
jgi:hypothetical protein